MRTPHFCFLVGRWYPNTRTNAITFPSLNKRHPQNFKNDALRPPPLYPVRVLLPSVPYPFVTHVRLSLTLLHAPLFHLSSASHLPLTLHAGPLLLLPIYSLLLDIGAVRFTRNGLGISSLSGSQVGAFPPAPPLPLIAILAANVPGLAERSEAAPFSSPPLPALPLLALEVGLLAGLLPVLTAIGLPPALACANSTKLLPRGDAGTGAL